MDEAEQNGAVQEIEQAISEPIAEAEQEETLVEDTHEERRQDRRRQDRNWSEINRAKKELEQKARMQDELIQRLMSQPQAQQQPIPQEEDIIDQISKDDYVAGDKVAKGLKKIEDRFNKRVEEIEQRYEQKQKNSLFNDLKREFPDFDDIVNPETLSLLEETNPRLASVIVASNDPYSIAVQSYEYIKAKGLANTGKQSKRAKEVDTKIEQNKKTVQTPQAFDKRPMAQAFQMTDTMKKELQREMYNYAQQAGMGY